MIAPLLFVLAAIPPLYILIMIQYSAITVPFWDHTELIRWIAAWHDGTFHFSSLWAPHNHTRPFVYRLVMLFNAVLTDWDIRSEYIYMYVAIYGAFACHAAVITRLYASGTRQAMYPIILLLTSLVMFSPVGHNNHWWSMMFQLNATNFFIALGFMLVFLWPTNRAAHILAAASCWLAAYTLTNGLFAMAAIMVAFQLSGSQLLRPDRFGLFWAANLALVSACYLPGITMEQRATHPSIGELVHFSLAYLGAPFSGLLWFPYRNMFDIPISTVANVVGGCGLLATFACLGLHGWPRLRTRDPAAMVLFGFAGFAILSAVATGWARAAVDEYGVSNGNASRYTIFAAYLLLGQFYYLGAGFAQGWWDNLPGKLRPNQIMMIAATLFVVLSFVSYARALPVYADAHRFNESLSMAYLWGLEPMPEDKLIHPEPESVAFLKKELQLLQIGPYANRPAIEVPAAVGKFSQPACLSSTRTVTQNFMASDNGLRSLVLKFVTPNGAGTDGHVNWRLEEIGGADSIASGSLQGDQIKDWRPVRLKLPYLGSSKGKSYELVFTGSGSDVHAACLPLYEPVVGSQQPVIISDADEARRGTLTMEFTMEYAQ